MESKLSNTSEYESINAILERTRKTLPAITSDSDEDESADSAAMPLCSRSANAEPDKITPAYTWQPASVDACYELQVDEYMGRAQKGFLKHEAWVNAAVSLALQLQSSRRGGGDTQPDAVQAQVLGVPSGKSQMGTSAICYRKNLPSAAADVCELPKRTVGREDTALQSCASYSNNLTRKAAQLYTQVLIDELQMEACRTEMNHSQSESGEALLWEYSCTALPPADSLWSDEDM